MHEYLGSAPLSLPVFNINNNFLRLFFLSLVPSYFIAAFAYFIFFDFYSFVELRYSFFSILCTIIVHFFH